MIDLTALFEALISVVCALVAWRLIPWLKSRTTEQQQRNLLIAARVAVSAAEQIFGAGRGGEKLAHALSLLEKAGFHIDGDVARAVIEREVARLNGKA